MFILIPALLRDSESEHRLLRTLSRFPSGVPATLVLVTQGNRIAVSAGRGISAVIHEHFDDAIGKWTAIRYGLSRIPRSADAPVLLLDADDPITDASVETMFAMLQADRNAFVIGDRNTILLHADDQLSPQTRAFVEIFSNTLLLLTLRSRRSIPLVGPDIQSGAYVLSGAARRALSLEYIGDYGGELALYHELVTAGFEPAVVEIEPNKTNPSSYSVDKIVGSIAALPFFRSASPERMLEAVNLSPRIYGRFLRQSAVDQFRLELSRVLRGAFPEFSMEPG